MSDDPNRLKEEVRSRYAKAATRVATREAGASGIEPTALRVVESCCGDATTDRFGPARYAADNLEQLPVSTAEASLGCGDPTAIATLHEGQTVLDLGSGGGIDVLLSARRVGPDGKVYGLDMTDEMLDLARRNAAEAGADNVEFLKGEIESIPLPNDHVDVVISNCVINLSVQKDAVFSEIFRTLRPGGRLGVTDVVADNDLTASQRAERGEWTGCIAGALSISEYQAGLAEAGFVDITVEPTAQVADGMHSAVIKAAKPSVA